jgi:hypothetical protein
MVRWKCICTWEAERCQRWAQSNGHRLCQQHFKLLVQVQNGARISDAEILEQYQTAWGRQTRLDDAEILASFRNNGGAAPAENVHNRINNNDNLHVDDDPQPAGIPQDVRQRLLARPPVGGVPTEIRNDGVQNQINNIDNHPVAEDPQPVGIPTDGHQRLLPQSHPTRHQQTFSEQQSAAECESERRFAARQEESQQFQGSEQRAGDPPVGNVLREIADNNEQLLDVAFDENIGNQANNNNNDNVMGLTDAAVDECIDYQANDNESQDDGVVDDPVGDVPANIGAVENIVETVNENIGIMAYNEENHNVVGAPVDTIDEIAQAITDVREQGNECIDYQANDNESHDDGVVDDPVGDVPPNIGAVENIVETVNENIGIMAYNEENHNVEGAPVDTIDEIAQVAAVETTTGDVREQENEWSSHIDHQLQSIHQQLQSKDNTICDLVERIRVLEQWKHSFNSTMWPSCTSIGGYGYDIPGGSSDISQGQTDISQLHPEEYQGCERDQEDNLNGGKEKGRELQKKRGNKDLTLVSTVQPPTKRTKAPNNEEKESPYYRNFTPRRNNIPTSVTTNAHAGLRNCDVICYSNAIFQCIASCIHVSDFLQTPPSVEHQQFPLYYTFASVINSMVSGQDAVVDPTSFVNLFRDKINKPVPQQGMFVNSQWMKQLT